MPVADSGQLAQPSNTGGADVPVRIAALQENGRRENFSWQAFFP
jgi:hypothetical protein